MLEKFVKRENLIFDILQSFVNEKLDFVVIGGYGISAYKHRFSVDADLVIKKEDLERFEKILLLKNFIKTKAKELGHVYAPIFIRYEFKKGLPVSIDLLVNAVAARQTNAQFSFELLRQNSKKRKIIGTEKEITVKVPDKEMLIALKIHSGRLTDLRDIAALCSNVNKEKIMQFIKKGEQEVVIKHAEMLLSLLEKKEFIDSFKGVFAEKKYEIDIECIRDLMQNLMKIQDGKKS